MKAALEGGTASRTLPPLSTRRRPSARTTAREPGAQRAHLLDEAGYVPGDQRSLDLDDDADGASARSGQVEDCVDAPTRALEQQDFTDVAAAMRHVLRSADLLGRVRTAGLRPSDETALRARLLITTVTT